MPTANPAKAIIDDLLRRYGLESLTDWAYDQLIEGSTPERIDNLLYDQPEFRTRFGGIFQREDKGLPPISVNEYLAWEQQNEALRRSYGLQPMDQQQTANTIGNNASMVEMEQRYSQIADAVYTAPPEYLQALESQYGITPDQLAPLWENPETGLQEIQKQWRAGKIGGEAQRQGFGDLTAAEAEEIAAGADEEQAGEAFARIGQARGMLGQMAGETRTGITRETMIDAIGGQAEAIEAVEGRIRERIGTFEGTRSQFAQSERGFAI